MPTGPQMSPCVTGLFDTYWGHGPWAHRATALPHPAPFPLIVGTTGYISTEFVEQTKDKTGAGVKVIGSK